MARIESPERYNFIVSKAKEARNELEASFVPGRSNLSLMINEMARKVVETNDEFELFSVTLQLPDDQEFIKKYVEFNKSVGKTAEYFKVSEKIVQSKVVLINLHKDYIRPKKEPQIQKPFISIVEDEILKPTDDIVNYEIIDRLKGENESLKIQLASIQTDRDNAIRDAEKYRDENTLLNKYRIYFNRALNEASDFALNIKEEEEFLSVRNRNNGNNGNYE